MKIQSSGRCTIIQSTTLFELVICSSEQPAQSSLMMCGSMIFKLWPLVSHRPSSRAHLIYFPMSFSFLKMLSTSTPSNGNLSRLCVRVATTNTNRTVTASQDFILFRPISSGEGYLNRDDFEESGFQEASYHRKKRGRDYSNSEQRKDETDLKRKEKEKKQGESYVLWMRYRIELGGSLERKLADLKSNITLFRTFNVVSLRKEKI